MITGLEVPGKWCIRAIHLSLTERLHGVARALKRSDLSSRSMASGRKAAAGLCALVLNPLLIESLMLRAFTHNDSSPMGQSTSVRISKDFR